MSLELIILQRDINEESLSSAAAGSYYALLDQEGCH